LTSDYASLKVHSKSINEDYLRLKEDLKNTNAHLKKSDEIRQQNMDNLNELKQKFKAVQEAYQERDEMLKTYKRKYDEE